MVLSNFNILIGMHLSYDAELVNMLVFWFCGIFIRDNVDDLVNVETLYQILSDDVRRLNHNIVDVLAG